MSNLEILSAVHGIAPRSDELLRLGSAVERGRAYQAEYDALLAHEEQAWLGVQQEAGIDIQENGKLRWQDHLRPIVKATTGFAPDIDNAPLTRWFDTNRFYRKPTITGPLTFLGEVFEEETGGTGDNISLIGPGTFRDLCDNPYGHEGKGDVTDLYLQIIDHLASKGVERTTLVTPFYAGEQEKRPFLFLSHYYPEPIEEKPKQFWLPIVSTSTTATDRINFEAWPRAFDTADQPTRLILTHTVDCEHLPLPYAQRKIRALGELTTQLKERWGENQ